MQQQRKECPDYCLTGGTITEGQISLQELKVTDEDFPVEPLEKAKIQAVVFGQKTYNGVAILATKPATARCQAAWIDRDARKGKKPSDHAPMLAEFKW